MEAEKMTDALLDGYNGPFFPEAINELNHLYRHNGRWTGKVLRGTVGKFISGYLRMEPRIKTSDDYYWFWGLDFMVEGGLVRILFPWSERKIGQEFSMPHSSIAVYTQGKASDEAIEHILRVTTKRFDDRLRFEIPALKQTAHKGP